MDFRTQDSEKRNHRMKVSAKHIPDKRLVPRIVTLYNSII